MKYTVDDWVFEKVPVAYFGIIVAKGLKNTKTNDEDALKLKAQMEALRKRIPVDQLKIHPDIAGYRDALKMMDINPNKYMNSVEAMTKRVLKGSDLPNINALVDLCNAISLEQLVSLGAHDLNDLDSDLEVRLSKDGDCFLPIGSESFEDVPAGEVVFTSGTKIQTRQWLWRQGELGKITEESTDIFFQLVGFEGEHLEHLKSAMEAVEKLVSERFGGTYETFLVSKDNPSIAFES